MTEGTKTVCGGRTGRVAEGTDGGMFTVDALGVTDALEDADVALGVGVTERSGGSGLDRPDCRPVRGVFAPDLNCELYSMILKMFLGSLLEVTTVVTPAAVAISASVSAGSASISSSPICTCSFINFICQGG